MLKSPVILKSRVDMPVGYQTTPAAADALRLERYRVEVITRVGQIVALKMLEVYSRRQPRPTDFAEFVPKGSKLVNVQVSKW